MSNGRRVSVFDLAEYFAEVSGLEGNSNHSSGIFENHPKYNFRKAQPCRAEAFGGEWPTMAAKESGGDLHTITNRTQRILLWDFEETGQPLTREAVRRIETEALEH